MSIDYQGKDLPVVIVNRHFKSLTEMPNGLVNVSDVIEAISDAVFHKNIPEEKRINLKQVPEVYKLLICHRYLREIQVQLVCVKIVIPQSCLAVGE